MATNSRPLSPHLQVYRPQMTSVLSITHRGTGIALFAGTVLLVYWLLAMAAGPQFYANAQAVLGSSLGRVVLFLWSFALFYHLCNGVRHLFWDAGYGFELKTVYTSGVAVLVASGALTLLAWIGAYAFRGTVA